MMGPVYDVLQGEYERQSEEGFCTKVVDGMTNFIFTNRFGKPRYLKHFSKNTCPKQKGQQKRRKDHNLTSKGY